MADLEQDELKRLERVFSLPRAHHKKLVQRLIKRIRELKREQALVATEVVGLGHNDDCLFCGLKDKLILARANGYDPATPDP